ncbi:MULTISPECIES: glycine betaine ABC transporter substrate-binding protein [unclassified Devosia]|uniref:glycine betaine ABC transporter substrate-binding protein n=1 Tax=unclassified Devosia TaxID=196773 RepID=UPI001553357F|nr:MULTISPECIES: glycine betaine ABC transporter substrate-binding protein [unclassified Devosia]
MKQWWTSALLAATVVLGTNPALAQVTTLETPGGTASAQAPAPSTCGSQPMTIARMSWPSAALLAEIHARVLRDAFGCQSQVLPGDMANVGSSMGSTGQPAIAPEMWVTRIAEVWNTGLEAQKLRAAGDTYGEEAFEGWFIPDYVAASRPELESAAGLAEALPALGGDGPVKFISCPADWACALINRNLIRALGLEDLLEVVEPANRFEMDTLIASAVSAKEPFVFYYWQPNAVLAQFDFAGLDMGAYDEAAAQCLARLQCPEPKPSAFVPDVVVGALAEWVFTEAPQIAAYFSRASMPVSEMNTLLAQINEPGATVEAVADRFVAERGELWRDWVGTPPAP